MVDEGAKALHKIDSELKEVKENPLESALNKSMEVVDDVVTHRLESTDERNAPKVSKPTKLSATTDSLLKKATEIVSIAKQDPTLAKVVNPLDEKAQELKHSSVGSILTKSVELVEDGMETMNQNPAELMVSKAMDFVDEKAQINSAKLIAKSRQLVDQVKDNPTDSLLTGSMNMVSNAVNKGAEAQNIMQSVIPPGYTPKVSHNATSMSPSSMLSTAMGMVGTGLQAVKQDPAELSLSKAMKFAVDKAASSNPVVAKTVGLVTTVVSSEDPAEALLQEIDSAVTETMPSLNNESFASIATEMIDSSTQPMEQIPEDSVFKKAIRFVDDDDSSKMLTKPAVGLVTNLLSSQEPLHNATVLVQHNIDNEQLSSGSSMLSGVTRLVDTGVTAMKHDPDNSVLSKLVSDIAQESVSTQIPEIVSLTDPTKQNPTEHVMDSLKSELQSMKQETTRCAVATEALDENKEQNNAKSVVTDAAKSVTFGKLKAKKSHSKKSLPHSQ